MRLFKTTNSKTATRLEKIVGVQEELNDIIKKLYAIQHRTGVCMTKDEHDKTVDNLADDLKFVFNAFKKEWLTVEFRNDHIKILEDELIKRGCDLEALMAEEQKHMQTRNPELYEILNNII